MSQPQILEIAGGYQFVWNSTENVKVKVTHLHSNSDGGLKGELHITTSAEGYSPHIYLGQFNFSGNRSRKELAKQLESVYPIDWEALLEQLIVRTVEMVRRGEPTEEIYTDTASLEPPKYLVEPFIIENYPNVFFGDPGSFKSTISLAIIAIMSLPWRDNPLRLSSPDNPVNVLFLDWETDKATVSWQLSCFQKGMETGPIPIKYRRCSIPLYNDLEQIQNTIADNKIKFIVIDSLGLACGGELNEAGTAIQFFTALRKLKVTSLILAHTSKDKQSPNKSIYGSVYFEAQARNVWYLKKRQEAGEDDLDLILRNTKSPPFRKKYQDLSFHVKFTEDSMTIKTQDPRTVSDFLETMSNQTRITEYLKENGPQSPKQLSEALDIDPGTTRKALFDLKKKNLVAKSNTNDTYALCFNES